MNGIQGTYRNPLQVKGIGDPFVLRASNGIYYCYPTSAPNEGYQAWSSTDLVHWQKEGFVYEKKDHSWGYKQFWAPEVVEHRGKYYMYYTARWKEKDSLRIGLAVADRPTGPFIDAYDRPLFDFDYAAIDANVLMDTDGTPYLYYSRDCSENVIEGRHESHIYGIRLSGDLMRVTGEPVLLAQPEQDWEKNSGPEYYWNEGAFVFKQSGVYYLMYSANFYNSRHYSVGYATSSHPLGPFNKYAHNPVLASHSEDVSGPGHHSVVMSPDGSERFVVYHTHIDPIAGSGKRQMCIDRLGFRPDGSIYVDGPTATDQAMPK